MNLIIPIIFAIAALLGVFLLKHILTDKNVPQKMVMIHGAFAAIGILVLAYYAYSHPQLWLTVGLFVMAALGGFYMFSLDRSGKKVPKWLAIGHGTLAIVGFVYLIIYLFMPM